jgi:hypothetical protein
MTADVTITRVLHLIRAEYHEMPGLCLTQPQMQRLWTLDPVTCGAVVDALLVTRVLKRTARDAYVLASGSGC